MRLRALFPFLLSWVLSAMAVTMCHICSSLDRLLERGAVTLDTLTRGDLHELLKLQEFWGFLMPGALVPFLQPFQYYTQMVRWPSMVPIALFAIGLAVIWRRRGRTDYARAGMLCLGFALVPWFAGRFLLTGIHAPSEAGLHCLLMIAGLFWCAVASTIFCGCQLFARRERSAAPAPALAPAT